MFQHNKKKCPAFIMTNPVALSGEKMAYLLLKKSM